MIDMTKLSPPGTEARSVYVQEGSYYAYVPHRETIDEARTDAKFFTLARNAFDVMMRRGWSVGRKADGKWRVDVPARKPYDGGSWECLADDPFTALVEADAWFKANVEVRT